MSYFRCSRCNLDRDTKGAEPRWINHSQGEREVCERCARDIDIREKIRDNVERPRG